MIFVSGRVSKLLRDLHGELEGVLLEDGREVRFTAALGRAVSSILTPGCPVGIEGATHSDGCRGGYLDATLVFNLDSRESASLPALKHKGKPGMQSNTTPVKAASLAPNQIVEEEANSGRQENGHIPNDLGEAKNDSSPLHSASFFQNLLHEESAKGTHFDRNEAGRSIGLAYDSLHRIQAILAYLHIIKHRVPGISQFLDEAKHTYEQALSRFSADDFVSAKEFAEASASLSRVVEIVMARTLRADTTLPSLVPPPPEQLGAVPEPGHVEKDLAHAELVLSRIHWVLEHGTLPTEDRAQVRKIASWGDAFYRQAQHTYRNAVLDDASEFAQAALAGAYSAEHVCRKWYANHPANP